METNSMSWANSEPYSPIENNPRVGEDEVVWCMVCHEEAVAISNNGRQGLCWDHYAIVVEAYEGA